MEQLDAELPIRDIFAREIFDCDGNLTVETEVLAGDGIVGRVSVPSGTDAGNDAGADTGNDAGADAGNDAGADTGAEKAVEIINTHIAQELIGRNVFDQKEIDKALTRLDGPNGSNGRSALGTQAVFGVSAAAARAAAAALKLPLYRYLGGVHAKSMPVPEVSASAGVYLIPSGALSLRGQLAMCIEILRLTGTVSADVRKMLDRLERAAERAGFQAGKDVTFGLRASASWQYDRERGCYRFPYEESVKEGDVCRTAKEAAAYYEELAEEFHVSSIEDPLDCEDWNGWAQMTGSLGNRVQLSGDALFRSDPGRLEKGIKAGAANAVVIRAGAGRTLSGLSDLIKRAQEAGYSVTVAHNAGETADTLAADLAVAFRAARIRTGYPCHMEYMEKCNRLLRIEEKIRGTD